MANTSADTPKSETGKSLLVKELEKVHPALAKKVHATERLHASLAEVDGMREMTDEQADEQFKNALVVNEAVNEQAMVRAVEYGVFVARGPIDIGGARAYNRGDAVPVSVVERFDLEKRNEVRRAGVK